MVCTNTDDLLRRLGHTHVLPDGTNMSVVMKKSVTPPTADLFDQVAAGYTHVQKLMRPAPALIAPAVYQKWYLVHPHDSPFRDEDVAVAQAFLKSEIDGERLALRHEVGFTVQHRCAAIDIFYVCSWRDNNELWETLYYKPHGGTFSVAPRDTKTATYCVWVIPAVAHEQRAWLEFLRSDRGAAARDAYCRDQASGRVG